MPTQRAESPIYQSYLLRLWRDKPSGAWRVSLQSTATEELRHFATLDELWMFLQIQLAVERDAPPTTPTSERADDRNSPAKEVQWARLVAEEWSAGDDLSTASRQGIKDII